MSDCGCGCGCCGPPAEETENEPTDEDAIELPETNSAEA